MPKYDNIGYRLYKPINFKVFLKPIVFIEYEIILKTC